MWEDEIKGAASNGRRGGGSRRRRVKKPWHEIFGERERYYLLKSAVKILDHRYFWVVFGMEEIGRARVLDLLHLRFQTSMICKSYHPIMF